VPGQMDIKKSGNPYYNNGFTKAMFNETLKETMEPQSSKDYFPHYYTYGTALRSSLSAAIN
jgi:hypothetical protein